MWSPVTMFVILRCINSQMSQDHHICTSCVVKWMDKFCSQQESNQHPGWRHCSLLRYEIMLDILDVPIMLNMLDMLDILNIHIILNISNKFDVWIPCWISCCWISCCWIYYCWSCCWVSWLFSRLVSCHWTCWWICCCWISRCVFCCWVYCVVWSIVF